MNDALARQVLYGASPGPGRLTPARWLRSVAGGRQVAARAGRLAVGWLLRHGGAYPQTIWDAAGRVTATGPLWDPALQAAGDWRLSAAAGDLLLSAAAIEAGEAAPESLVVRLPTPLDLALGEALLTEVDRRGLGRRSAWPAVLRVRSPLAALWRPELPVADVDRLAPWLDADWLLPFLEAHTIRRWLAVEARRRLLEAPAQRVLNRQLTTLYEHLWGHWEGRGRVEHLALFARFYPRWLALHGGVGGFLKLVRGVPLGRQVVSEREQFEQTFGSLLVPAMRLVTRAAELRGYGWQRTPAEERFLGIYSREFEPAADELQTLHDALWRIL